MAMDLARVVTVTKHYAKTLHGLEQLIGFPGRLREEQVEYLVDFCDRLVDMIEREPERREKIMRWYGFVQGAVWSMGVFSVDEIKEHSNPDVPPPK